MAIRTLLAVFLTVLLTVAPVAAQQPQTPIFRSGTEVVDLYVTATDRNGRLVPNLLQEDFVVLDEGEVQEIVLFENEVRPITVVVMLDTSASMTPSLDLLMAGAEQFIIRMLPDDRGKVGAFNDKIQILPDIEFTGDRDLLIRELDRLQFVPQRAGLREPLIEFGAVGVEFAWCSDGDGVGQDNAGEVSLQAVEVDLEQRVELVVVTLSTSDGESEEDAADV